MVKVSSRCVVTGASQVFAQLNVSPSCQFLSSWGLDRGDSCCRIAADNGWAASSVQTVTQSLRSGVSPNQYKGRAVFRLVRWRLSRRSRRWTTNMACHLAKCDIECLFVASCSHVHRQDVTCGALKILKKQKCTTKHTKHTTPCTERTAMTYMFFKF